MADTVIQANCGFFNAVNNDRVYSADDMNKPYRNVLVNGIFLSSDGKKNSYFMCSVSNLVVTVQPGSGLFDNKWFSLDESITFTVPANISGNSRIDSIIVQVNNKTTGRCGNVVYRPGVSMSPPVAPAINTDPDVIEYRIANITVAPHAVNVGVVDLRGSETPWVTPVMFDSGWVDIALESGITAYNTSRKPQVRRIGNVVYLRGSVKGATGSGAIASVTTDYVPSQTHIFTSAEVQNSAVLINTLVMIINTGGVISILASSGSMSGGSTYEIVLNTSFAL